MRTRTVPEHPTILLFDSGLGGLTVFREIKAARPDARFTTWPMTPSFLTARTARPSWWAAWSRSWATLIDQHRPALVVIACNTASTLVLPHLRERYDVPFVGTVPAIKPACAASQTKRVSVLGTEGTVSREYTRALIRDFGNGADVTLVGSAKLAAIAEAELRGNAASDAAIAQEIAPCFVDEGGRRTDTIVLACTHFPLLLSRLERLAPWPVSFIDPAPAIARRVLELIGPPSAADAPPAPRSCSRPGHRPRTGWPRRLRVLAWRAMPSNIAPRGDYRLSFEHEADAMAQGPTTVRRTLQFKFTLPTGDASHLASLVKAGRPFIAAFGGKRVRLLQNVDDPKRIVQEIEYETHEASSSIATGSPATRGFRPICRPGARCSLARSRSTSTRRLARNRPA